MGLKSYGEHWAAGSGVPTNSPWMGGTSLLVQELQDKAIHTSPWVLKEGPPRFGVSSALLLGTSKLSALCNYHGGGLRMDEHRLPSHQHQA